VGLERAGKGASFLGWGVTNQVTDSLSDALQSLTIRWMSLVRAGGRANERQAATNEANDLSPMLFSIGKWKAVPREWLPMSLMLTVFTASDWYRTQGACAEYPSPFERPLSRKRMCSAPNLGMRTWPQSLPRPWLTCVEPGQGTGHVSGTLGARPSQSIRGAGWYCWASPVWGQHGA
jgi:hypothetical protein